MHTCRDGRDLGPGHGHGHGHCFVPKLGVQPSILIRPHRAFCLSIYDYSGNDRFRTGFEFLADEQRDSGEDIAWRSL